MKLIVLDFAKGITYIYNLNKDIKEWINEEEILIDYGHRPTNCQWMLTKNEIIII